MEYWFIRPLTFVVICYCVLANTVSSAGDPAKDPAPAIYPTFLEHPQNALIAYNDTVTLSCKAKPVMDIFFKCNDYWMDTKRHHYLKNDDDERDHVMYVTITLTNDDIDSESGEYWCQCIAWAEGDDNSGESKKAYVTKSITVTTGDNRELFLPDGSSANLLADVSPATQPTGEPFEFQWTLLPSSRFDELTRVEMVGRDRQILQLSKLTAGEYNFEVVVRGDNSYGIGHVNVTVHPANTQFNSASMLKDLDDYKATLASEEVDKAADSQEDDLQNEDNSSGGSLSVTTNDDIEISLPENSVYLYATVVPKKQPNGQPYVFEWTLLPSSRFDVDTMPHPTTDDSDKQVLHVYQLTTGEYHFQVQVYGDNLYGTDYIDVIVHSASKTKTNTWQPDQIPRPTTPTRTKSTVGQQYQLLTVKTGGNRELFLPHENSIDLYAVVEPATPPTGKAYVFDWSILPSSSFYVNATHPEMVGRNANILQMSKLTAGDYHFQVDVRGENSYGNDQINITVHPDASETTASSDVLPDIQEAGQGDGPVNASLSVEAGDNIELTLPDETSVSLFADVKPANPIDGTPYQFEWILLPSSRFELDDENTPPEIYGRLTQTLQLSQLVAGEYNFKVEVRGDNTYGTDYINVTVHPLQNTHTLVAPTMTPEGITNQKSTTTEPVDVKRGKRPDISALIEQLGSKSPIPTTIDDVAELCQNLCPSVDGDLTDASTETIQRKLLLLEINKTNAEIEKLKLEREILQLQKEVFLQQLENEK